MGEVVRAHGSCGQGSQVKGGRAQTMIISAQPAIRQWEMYLVVVSSPLLVLRPVSRGSGRGCEHR